MVLGELSTYTSLLSGEAKAIPRVPGSVPPLGAYKHEKKHQITENSSLREMLEALCREKRIASNSKLIKSLPDGGEKVRRRVGILEDFIEKKKKFEEEEATRLLSELNISKVDIESLEWNTKSSSLTPSTTNDENQNSEESSDPLQILAEKELPPKASKCFDPHVEHLSSKVDDLKPSARFIPYTSVSIPEGDTKKASLSSVPLTRTSDLSKIRKPSELMPLPPDIKHQKGVQPITLNESLRIQIQKDKELKELQIKRAAQKLIELRSDLGITTGDIDIKDSMNYRNKADSEEDSDDSTEFATPEGPSDDES